MTKNYKKLLQIAKEKFGSLQDMSMNLHGYPRRYVGWQNLKDSDQNNDLVQKEIRDAQDRDLIRDCRITEADSKYINQLITDICRIQTSKLRHGKYKKTDLYRDLDFPFTMIHNIINRNYKYKTSKYHMLVDRLEIMLKDLNCH